MTSNHGNFPTGALIGQKQRQEPPEVSTELEVALIGLEYAIADFHSRKHDYRAELEAVFGKLQTANLLVQSALAAYRSRPSKPQKANDNREPARARRRRAGISEGPA